MELDKDQDGHDMYHIGICSLFEFQTLDNACISFVVLLYVQMVE